MFVRSLLAALALLAVAACTDQGLRATMTDISDVAYTHDPEDPRNCAISAILLMTVTDRGKEIASERVCGHPFYNFATAFRDRDDHAYVVRVSETSEGTGTQAQDVYLERVDVGRGTLYEVVTLPWSEPDPTTDPWNTTYQISDTGTGGSKVTFTYPVGDFELPERQMIVRLGAVGTGAPMPARAAPEAVVRPAPPESWCNSLGQGFEMVTLAIVDGSHTLAHQDYCRDPGETDSVQTAVDRRGRIYVLWQTHAPIRHSTTGSGSGSLSVYEVSGDLTWMGDILLSPPTDPAHQWPTTYALHDTENGGLEVVVDYSAVKSDGCCNPPEQKLSLQLGP